MNVGMALSEDECNVVTSARLGATLMDEMCLSSEASRLSRERGRESMSV